MKQYFKFQWIFFFHTGPGRCARVFLLLWTFAFFVEVAPTFAMACFLSAMWVANRGIFRTLNAWLRFAGLASPRQLIRSYQKLWPSVKAGPVTKMIKVKGPTP